MFMLALSETIDQLAMANNDRWYGHVMRREGGHDDLIARFQRMKIYVTQVAL